MGTIKIQTCSGGRGEELGADGRTPTPTPTPTQRQQHAVFLANLAVDGKRGLWAFLLCCFSQQLLHLFAPDPVLARAAREQDGKADGRSKHMWVSE